MYANVVTHFLLFIYVIARIKFLIDHIVDMPYTYEIYVSVCHNQSKNLCPLSLTYV
jgi:hypothetical protein